MLMIYLLQYIYIILSVIFACAAKSWLSWILAHIRLSGVTCVQSAALTSGSEHQPSSFSFLLFAVIGICGIMIVFVFVLALLYKHNFIIIPHIAKRGGRVAKASGRESRGPRFDSRRRQLLRVTGP